MYEIKRSLYIRENSIHSTGFYTDAKPILNSTYASSQLCTRPIEFNSELNNDYVYILKSQSYITKLVHCILHSDKTLYDSINVLLHIFDYNTELIWTNIQLVKLKLFRQGTCRL
jgi:hypothetical protein